MSTQRQYIYINSEDRVAGTSDDFKIVIPYNNTPIDSVSLVSAQIPHSYYNVTSANNGIRFTGADATEQTVTITAGDYTLAELMTELKTALDTADTGVNTYTVAQDGNTNLITISADTNNFSLHWDNALSTVDKLFGFTDGALDTGANSYTGQSIPNIQRVDSLLIETDLSINASATSQGGVRPLLGIVNVNSNFGQVDFYDAGNQFIWSHDVNNGNLNNTLNFRLLDQDGSNVSLNGLDWSMTLLLTSRI